MLKRDALDTYLDRLASVAMIVAAVALVWVVVGTDLSVIVRRRLTRQPV